MENALKRATEAGYEDMCYGEKYINDLYDKSVLLDVNFWQFLGKAAGWSLSEFSWQKSTEESWRTVWNMFYEHLAKKGDIDSFFNKLLTYDK